MLTAGVTFGFAERCSQFRDLYSWCTFVIEKSPCSRFRDWRLMIFGTVFFACSLRPFSFVSWWAFNFPISGLNSSSWPTWPLRSPITILMLIIAIYWYWRNGLWSSTCVSVDDWPPPNHAPVHFAHYDKSCAMLVSVVAALVDGSSAIRMKSRSFPVNTLQRPNVELAEHQ